ncbi:MAG: hypothetical protein R3F43_10215 [bacterium]
MSGKTLALRDTTIGKKANAVTGVIMVGFVTAHMIGNLQAYSGREVFFHTRPSCTASPAPSGWPAWSSWAR